MSKILDVYLNNQLTGLLIQDRQGLLQFTYDANYLQSNGPALSQSLPLQKETFNSKQCRGFFAGILPENNKRKIIAKNLHISAYNDFALLEKIGGECAGAVTFLPHGKSIIKQEQSSDYHSLTDRDLALILRDLPKSPLLAGKKDIRLSLAGAQDKIAVAIRENQICLPLHGAASTHIIKPAIPQFAGIVTNEAFCLRLADTLNFFPAVKVSIHQVFEIEYLLIERYDRYYAADGALQRIHQEDFCQALGIPSELKYQNEGGPSIASGINLLRSCSGLPVLDIGYLLDAVIFNYLIGNYDAHGKNFSLLYTKQGARLAPLYDILSTAIYPELSQKMAMKIGSTYKAKEVNARQWEKLSAACDISAKLISARIKEIAAAIGEAAETVALQLKKELKQKQSKEVIEQILKKIQQFSLLILK